jgi:hypothetical protein
MKAAQVSIAILPFSFFSRRVLDITTGMDDLGGMKWELFGTLVLAWLIVYGIIWKGLHSSGKVIWFTVSNFFESYKRKKQFDTRTII